jgi:hypothetical protein
MCEFGLNLVQVHSLVQLYRNQTHVSVLVLIQSLFDFSFSNFFCLNSIYANNTIIKETKIIFKLFIN